MEEHSRRWAWMVTALVVALAGVGIAVWPDSDEPPVSPEGIVVPNPDSIYDPVSAGEELPDGYRPLLVRDRIRPIYNPVFVDADEVDWPDEMLVIGVWGDEQAKAYPVTYLNQREMVNDELEGTPILVSW